MSQKSSYQLKISSNALALEQLTRPLLRLLSQVTGMESAYLTIIDSDRGRQYVQYEPPRVSRRLFGLSQAATLEA
jgi:diguanylate cyclase